MKKQMVYLFSLDSVMNDKEAALIGQQQMFDEIVNNGKCIVISFNQLTDSYAFFAPIISERSEGIFEPLLKLFDKNALKILRYRPIISDTGNRAGPVLDNLPVRTAAQYVLDALSNAINSNTDGSRFIFSSLPVKRENKKLLRVIYDSIRFSDLSRIEELIKYKNTNANDEQAQIIRDCGAEDIYLPELKYINRYIYWILKLSRNPLSYVDVKQTDYRLFTDYLDIILGCNDLPSEFNEIRHYFIEAKETIKTLQPTISCPHRRSVWLQSIQANSAGKSIEIIWFAEQIVNLCYNYAVEESIDGISKPYHDDNQKLIVDFAERLSDLYQKATHESFITSEATPNLPSIEPEQFPDWDRAVRIIDEARDGSQSNWNRNLYIGQIKKIARAAWYVVLVAIARGVINFIELIPTKLFDCLGINLDSTPFLTNYVLPALGVLLATFIIGALSCLFSKKIEIPEITVFVKHIKEALIDITYLANRKKEKSND